MTPNVFKERGEDDPRAAGLAHGDADNVHVGRQARRRGPRDAAPAPNPLLSGLGRTGTTRSMASLSSFPSFQVSRDIG